MPVYRASGAQLPPSTDFVAFIESRIAESVAVKQAILCDRAATALISEIAANLADAFRAGRKLLLFGNGGSAADAQHMAAELVSRFRFDRPALPAIALTVNTSCLTAIANDVCYESIFARQIEALAYPGDIALGISTSGNSPNVLRAIERANAKGARTIGLSGKSGGELKRCAQRCLCVPSEDTTRIQEAHILIGHILCEIVERELFGPAPLQQAHNAAGQLQHAAREGS
jgi:D-sedoheptulose 7-phosphate isomerase